MNSKTTSASTVADIQKEKTFICGKIKDFAILKCDIADFFSSSTHSDVSFIGLMTETVNAADEFYMNLLSIYGALVEKEVDHE